MKVFKNLLAFTLTATILLFGAAQPAAALGGWVDHKFEIQRADGTRMDLKGAKMHVYHRTQEGGFKNVNSFCAYPDKDNNIAKYVDEDNDADEITLSSGYHCLTPQSCTNSDYGAPYLPKSFNSNESIYFTGNDDNAADASYRAFHDTNFTTAFAAFFGPNAPAYREGNIRGFDNTKWEISVDWNNGSGVTKATQAEIDQLERDESAWGNIPGISGRQEWSEGEVYRDPAGENQLHARITWVLKPPAAPAVKPTASLAGKCATTNPGVPSYTYTLSNIDLKGQQFVDTHLYLKIPKGSWTEEMTREFGPPLNPNNTTMDYSLIFNTTVKPDANRTITLTVAPTEGIGNKAENTKTVADLVKWVDARRKSGALVPPFEIASTLNSSAGLTDYIGTGTSGFKPKFETDECGKAPVTPPPSGGVIPACVEIRMLNADKTAISNASALTPGYGLKFECAKVAGVSKYAFKVSTFNEQGVQIGTSQNLQPESEFSNYSQTFYIPDNGGRFTAQCGLCDSNSGSCSFGVTNYLPPSSGSTNTGCIAPNSCVTSAGCMPGATVAGKTCPVSGQICCSNRTRDPVTTPSPTPTPASTTCASPNSCITASTCATANRVAGKVCPTSGQVCCTTRPRDPVTTPTPTPTPASTTCVSPNSCISSGACATANRVAGKVCPTSGQVCCTTRPREE